MERVAELVRNLTLLVVLAVFLELWLPTGEMRRYVRLVCGLLLVAAALQVILTGLRSGTEFCSLPPVGSSAVASASSPEWQKKAEELYRESLARQVKALSRLAGLPVDQVEVLLEEGTGGYPRLREIKLYVSHGVPASTASADEGASEAVKTLADFYNLPQQKITLVAP